MERTSSNYLDNDPNYTPGGKSPKTPKKKVSKITMKKQMTITDKDKAFQMIDLLNTKINELPRPLNQPSRKQYNLYKDIISTLKEFARID